MQRAIEFDDVAFAYPNRGAILSHLTFRIAHGTFVAFVGPSGAGKSTIFNLLAGFNVPSEGRLRIDGHDITRVDARSLRAQIGFVFQESILFNATLDENIRLDAGDAPRDRVERAAKAAQIDEAIARDARRL